MSQLPFNALVCCTIVLPLSLVAQQAPKRPCNVDVNAQPVLYTRVPQSSFDTIVLPATHRVLREFMASPLKTTIPFEDVWTALGLTLLFPPPGPGSLHECCPYCAVPCGEDLQVRSYSDPQSAANATFTLTLRPNAPRVLRRRISMPGQTLVWELRMAARGSGFALFGPNTTQFFFGDNTPARLIVTEEGNPPRTLFDGAVACIGTHASWGVIVPFGVGNAIPRLPLYIEPR